MFAAQASTAGQSTDGPAVAQSDDGFEPEINDDEPIIVTGERRRYEFDEFDDDNGGGGGGGHGEGGGGGGGEPPPAVDVCQDVSQMTPEEREDYEVAVEAAEIAREIQSMADRDGIEYGSIIYRDSNGLITHTAISRGTATSVQINALGMVDWGTALGIIHSHPATLYNSINPDFRLYPTPYEGWNAFNETQAMIANDLQNNHGFSYNDAWAMANEFVYFIYGASGALGTGSYGLHRFGEEDETRQATGADQLSHAESVNLDLGTCGG